MCSKSEVVDTSRILLPNLESVKISACRLQAMDKVYSMSLERPTSRRAPARPVAAVTPGILLLALVAALLGAPGPRPPSTGGPSLTAGPAAPALLALERPVAAPLVEPRQSGPDHPPLGADTPALAAAVTIRSWSAAATAARRPSTPAPARVRGRAPPVTTAA
jgi:hypothetical protein